ncbi:flagellar assembly protein FliW [Candidatus Kapaibacterium sp.]
MSTDKEKRKIVTLHFGELIIENDYIFMFPEGILGFENLREFVLISEEESEPFKWLISIDEPNIGFPLLSPWLIDIEYNPGKNFAFENLVLFCIVTLEDENKQMTANLKAPIVLNTEKQTGEQIILTNDKYSTNQVIGINK